MVKRQELAWKSNKSDYLEQMKLAKDNALMQNWENSRVLESIESYYQTQIQVLKEKIEEKKIQDKWER